MYDPASSPNADTWLAQSEQERITSALQAHRGCFPDSLHTADANPIAHAGLHAMVETQIAAKQPAITGRTLARLERAGLKRHSAVHLMMRELAVLLAQLGDGRRFDSVAWTEALNRLASVSPPPRNTDPPTQNRAERRKARRKKR